MRFSSMWIATLCLALGMSGCSVINDFGSFEFGDAGRSADAGEGTCDDGIQNGDETDTDCGGADCDLCLDGDGCLDDSDCESDFCDSADTCAQSSCTDGAVNGDETDIDCGGSCDPCGDGLSCGVNVDCESGLCDGGSCAASGCADGLQNGDETDVDCGGAVCPGCIGGEMCVDGDDCDSTVCIAGTCTPSACDDTILNGDESDVDCGGSCTPCADGLVCTDGTDCDSEVCDAGICISCVDGVMNADETDIDCGGATCAGCADGLVCTDGTDCDSGVCDAGICISCVDGVMNADETDIDCGGATCGGCGPGQMCTLTSDCVLGTCVAGACMGVPNSCNDVLRLGLSIGDGVYRIDADGPGGRPPYDVFCDMTIDGGGWTLTYKITNSVDSARNPWWDMVMPGSGAIFPTTRAAPTGDFEGPTLAQRAVFTAASSATEWRASTIRAGAIVFDVASSYTSTTGQAMRCFASGTCTAATQDCSTSVTDGRVLANTLGGPISAGGTGFLCDVGWTGCSFCVDWSSVRTDSSAGGSMANAVRYAGDSSISLTDTYTLYWVR